jgi:hypothetical protein
VSRRLAERSAGALGLKIFEPPIEVEPYTLQMLWHPRHEGDGAHAWLRGLVADAAEGLASSRLPQAI